MKFQSITKRWFLTVASIIIVILIVASTFLFLSLRNYYYGVADMKLDSHSADEVATQFNLYLDSSAGGFEDAGRNYIATFPDKDSMAVWIIDKGGNITHSTSGFEINESVEMPDFVAAVSGEGTSKWTGRLPSGEKIMSSTCAYN